MNRLLACLILTGRRLRQYIVVMPAKENHIALEKNIFLDWNFFIKNHSDLTSENLTNCLCVVFLKSQSRVGASHERHSGGLFLFGV